MADKSLKIGIQSDVSKGKELLKFLNELSNVGNATAKAFKSINLGAGSSALQGSLAKSLLDQKKLFSDLGQSGEKLSSILTKQVGKASEDLSKKLDETNKKLKKSIEDYEKYSNKIKDLKTSGGDVSVMEGKASAAQSDINRLLLEKGSLQKAQAGLGDGAVAGAGKGGAGLLSGLLPGGMMGAIGPAAIATLVVSVLKSIPGQMAESYRARSSQITASTDLDISLARGAGQFQVAPLTGDVMKSLAGVMVSRDKRLTEEKQKVGKLEKQATETEHSLWGTIAAMPIRDWPYALYGLDADAKGAAYGIKEEDRGLPAAYIKAKTKIATQEQASNVAQQNAEAGFIQKQIDANLERTLVYQDLIARSTHRLSVGRRLGSLDAAISSQKMSGDLKMDEGIIEGIKLGLVSAGGRRALKYQGSALTAALGGMEGGAAASIAGAGAVNGDLLATMRRPGLYDPVLLETLGKGATQFLGAGNQLVSNEGLINTLSSGIATSPNTALQLRALQQNMAGMQVGQTLFKGGDAYQKSTNLMNAISVLGKDSDIWAQNKLANMDFSDVMQILNDPKAKIPLALSGLGITRENLEQFAGKTISSTLKQRYYESGGGKSEASQLVKRIVEDYGGNYRDWARAEGKNKDFARQAEILSGILPEIDPSFGDSTQALGMLRVSAGSTTTFGGPPRKGGRGIGKGEKESDLAKATYDAAANQYEAAAAIQEKAAKIQKEAAELMKETLEEDRKQRLGGPRNPKGTSK
jgi:hypothetical protein